MNCGGASFYQTGCRIPFFKSSMVSLRIEKSIRINALELNHIETE